MRKVAMNCSASATLCIAAVMLMPIHGMGAQVAGAATVGVSVEEMKIVVLGWSARHKLLGAAVYNDKSEKIGSIDDIIVSPKRTVSHAIIGVGGFLGLVGKHEVAIPMDQIKLTSGRFAIAGASKDALKALPPFEYAK